MGHRDDSFWAEFLGIQADDWQTPGVSYRAHVGLSGYRGFWCFRRNDRVVVSAPARWVARLQALLAGWRPERLMEQSSLAEALGADFERSVGPAFQGCLEAERFVNRAGPPVRKLTLEDADAVERFRTECGTADWGQSGLDEAQAWRHAYFEGTNVTAMAGYRAKRDDAGDPCILTHPTFRGGGRGAAVASAVVADALSNGKLMLYQTLESNEAAVRLALTLGYERYANHVAVRLKREAPEP
jgi:GNAT superfamily N-acetyltransferase